MPDTTLKPDTTKPGPRSKIGDNPAAFPRPAGQALNEEDPEDSYYNAPQRGMTLRDWFAGQALAALIAEANVKEAGWEDYVASEAYGLADRLLEYRALPEVAPL